MTTSATDLYWREIWRRFCEARMLEFEVQLWVDAYIASGGI